MINQQKLMFKNIVSELDFLQNTQSLNYDIFNEEGSFTNLSFEVCEYGSWGGAVVCQP